jgi:hypothetical protein
MQPQPTAPGRWETDLDNFFGTLNRENDDHSRNIIRQGEFYARTVHPALDAAAEALRHHGRTCETGLDQHRVYVIVRRPEGSVEFQYAVVAEARIEGVTPYIHCWFEENPLAKTSGEDSGQTEDKAAQKPADEADDQQGEADKEGDEEPEDDKKKDDKKPARTKTIELLATWAAGRQLESVTQEELLADFVAHYKEAVAGLRTHLHAAPPAQS